MIDVTKDGQHVQLFRQHGLSAYSWLLTVNEALDLVAKLQAALDTREPLPALVPDD